ncbi:DUF58 domain-containing protein [bacterium]|nr:MAG: DUF58 domain-containing protein [bacterium]
MNGFQWLVAAVLTAAGGWVLGTSVGIGVGAAFALVAAFSWIVGARANPDRLLTRRDLDVRLVAAGEATLVRIRVSGVGDGPFVWTRIRDRVPAGVEIQGSTGRFSIGSDDLHEGFFYRASFMKRGSYRLGPVEIATGDLLGIRTRVRETEVSDEILVYPKVVPIGEAAVRSTRPFGDRRSDKRATEDPTRPVGARKFESGDALKRIHWPATARSGNLMSRLYDGASGPLAWIVPNLCRKDWPDEEAFELGMTVCASLAVGLSEVEGIAQTNLHEGVSDQARRETLLATIARLEGGETSFSERLIEERPHFPWRSTLIVVVSRLDADAAAVLDDLRRHGHGISLVAVGPGTSVTMGRAAAIGAEVARVESEEGIRGLAFFR